jgi:hypothetical protein
MSFLGECKVNFYVQLYLGPSKPVTILKTGFSVFKNCKTGIPVLNPVLKFFDE